MIPDIKELNFPPYATLSQATVNIADMSDKTITAQIKIDGSVAPDFSYDWAIEFKGEKYIHPLRDPQSEKNNDSPLSSVDLTFTHWAVYELKRYLFPEMTSIDSGTAIPDKWEASLSLTLPKFVIAFNNVLKYWHGDKIRMQLSPDYIASEEPVTVAISHSYEWDILQKIYELYAVRWTIGVDPEDSSKYIIKVGYPADELTHVFEYGFEGGLLKYERQVQSSDLRNVLYGRGGEKNLPAYYFKKAPDDSTFKSDPDYIPELENIHFDRLHDKNFRYYIQGWKDSHYTYDSEGVITADGTMPRRYAEGEIWAYDKGFTDTKFNPVEFVKDDDSIAKYGILMASLSNNDEIFPTIQGVTINPYGRIDQSVDVEQIESDDVQDTTESDSVVVNIDGASATADLKTNEYVEMSVKSALFEVPDGKVGTFDYELSATASYGIFIGGFNTGRSRKVAPENITLDEKESHTIKIYRVSGSTETLDNDANIAALSAGSYRVEVATKIRVEVSGVSSCTAALEMGACKVLVSTPGDHNWGQTFNVWIKNIWLSDRLQGESDTAFANRVWVPILGDRPGNEAKLVFSTGNLSVSEDYEFTIVDFAYDDSKTLDGVNSMWRLKLAKSDADLESLGLYVPSTKRQGNAGDYFFFTGIDMPFAYVVYNEQKLTDYKIDQLGEVKDINPTKVVTLDKIRAHTLLGDETETFVQQLSVGAEIKTADERFTRGAIEKVYVQSMTYNYNEPTDSESNLLPDIEIVLSNEVAVTKSTITTIQGDINALHRQLGSLSNIEAVIRNICDKLYLRKDGFSDRSLSPTEFYGLLKSNAFRQGRLGGSGWGIYRDGFGNTIIESDKIIARQSFDVSSLAVHQTEWVGGTRIESAAEIKCTKVEKAGIGYYCYFDNKQGTLPNLFVVGDVVYGQYYNPKNPSEVSFYKSIVGEVGDDYIAVSILDKVGSGEPSEGDIIVQYGHISNPERQFVKIHDVVGGGYTRYLGELDSPSAVGTEYFFVGRQSGNAPRLFIGNKDSYVDYNGTTQKVTIKGELDVNSTIGGETIDNYISNSEAVENIQNFVDVAIDGIQKQIDGVVETWFGEETPTLQNYPASEWGETSTARDRHLGDLYYDNLTGRAWRFSKNGDSYGWVEIQDTAITAALAAAAAAQDTADGKRRVFTSQPLDSQAYDVGDLWVNANYQGMGLVTTYKNDLLRCRTAKAAGAPFSISHWTKASKYTDDTTANAAAEAAEAAQTAAANLSTYVDGAFKDGIIDKNEATAIAKYLNTLESTMNQVRATYSAIYSNPYINTTIQANLDSKSDALDAAYDALVNAISTAIADGQATAEESTAVNSAFATFNSALSDFQSAVEAANKAIQDKLNELAHDAANAVAKAGRNLLLQTNQGALGWSITGVVNGTTQTYNLLDTTESDILGTKALLVVRTSAVLDESATESGYEVLSFQLNPERIEQGEVYTISFDAVTDRQLGLGVKIDKVSTGSGLTNEKYFTVKTTKQHFSMQLTASASGTATSSQVVRFGGGGGGIGKWNTLIISNLKLEKGKVETTWTPAPEDNNLTYGYLKTALAQSTAINGGLIQTSMIRLGYKNADNDFVPMSGTNGLYQSEKSLAFWAGGDMIDAKDDSANGATFAVRMDGTAYAAGNTVRFNRNQMEVGDNVLLSDSGLQLVDSNNNPKLSVVNQSVGIEQNYMQQTLYEATGSYTFGGTDIMLYNYTESGPEIGPLSESESEGVAVTSLPPIGEITPFPVTMSALVSSATHSAISGGMELTEGSVISGKVTISCVLATNKPKTPISLGVKIEKSGVTYGSVVNDFTIDSYGILYGDINFVFNITESGTYFLKFYFPQSAPSVVENSKRISGFNIVWNAQVAVGFASRTTIGNDGISSTWANSAFLVNNEVELLRVGNYILRVNSSGVQISTDGGQSWKYIQLTSLQQNSNT